MGGLLTDTEIGNGQVSAIMRLEMVELISRMVMVTDTRMRMRKIPRRKMGRRMLKRILMKMGKERMMKRRMMKMKRKMKRRVDNVSTNLL
jgi:hypothetical protein